MTERLMSRVCYDPTYVHNQSGVGLLQTTPQPQEVLVAPTHLILRGVKLAASGLVSTGADNV